jgi:hypothetical protein
MVTELNVVPRVGCGALGASRRIRRSAARPTRRGMTVLVVILVLGMLTAVGLFAARASQLGVSNSGRIRQASQTHYLSEMGVLTALSEFERDPVVYKNRLNVAGAIAPGSTGGKVPCQLVPYLPGNATFKPSDERCIRVGLGTMGARGGYSVLARRTTDAGGPVPGVLGFGDLAGNYGAELSDLTEVPAPVAGYHVGSTITSDMRLYRVTVLSTGQVLPTDASGTPFDITVDANRPVVTSLMSIEQSRAHLLVGPVK